MCLAKNIYLKKIAMVCCLSMLSTSNFAVETVQIEGLSPAANPSQESKQVVNDSLTATAAQGPQAAKNDANNQEKALIQSLIQKSNCDPASGQVCRVNIESAKEMFSYIGYCGILSGWELQYKPSSTLSLVLVGGGDTCQVVATDSHFVDSPSTVTCNLTKEQINEMMVAFSSGNDIEAYEKTGSVTDNILLKAKPLVDCLKPLSRVDKKIEIIPGAYSDQK